MSRKRRSVEKESGTEDVGDKGGGREGGRRRWWEEEEDQEEWGEVPT